MTKTLTIVILSLLTVSCAKRHDGESKPSLLSNLISITDNENRGVQEVTSFYGGQCAYSIGIVASTNDKKDRKYFELALSKSPLMKDYEATPDQMSSNISYRFYKNLNENERNSYSHIWATLLFDSGQKITHEYSIDSLNKVDKKMPLVLKLVGLIKEKKFNELKPFLNNEYIKYDKDRLVQVLEESDSQFGKAKEFQLYGFSFRNIDNVEILKIIGVVTRDIQNNKFVVDINPNSDKEEVLSLNYSW